MEGVGLFPLNTELYLPSYFVNEKSAILQSWLKSVLNLCKFIVYNTNFKTPVYFSFESPDFSAFDHHKIDD